MNKKEYELIIKDIMANEEFLKINYIEHHGTSRLKHSKRVSYYSYIICKILRLDYIATARAGLLHDFFISKEKRTKKERIKSTFTHPKKALEKANENFILNDKEQNIIVSHMFPINIRLPKYIESWIVSIIDKIVGTYEFLESISIKQTTVPNLYILLLLKIFN